MRGRHQLAYSLLFLLSGATGLIYELLWVRVLYQSFGSDNLLRRRRGRTAAEHVPDLPRRRNGVIHITR